MDEKKASTYKLRHGLDTGTALPSFGSKPDLAMLRQTMVDRQIRTFGVTDRAIIARFLEVPRENFVPSEQRALAYSDLSLKIEPAKPGSRRLLAPMVLARLLQEAEVYSGDRVLDVAPGTGYSTAILAGLARNVTALESEPELQALVKSNLSTLGLSVPVFSNALPDGVTERAPFDLILVNGAVEGHLEGLFAQLRDGGRLATFLRAPSDPDLAACHAIRFEKIAGQISSRVLFDAPAPLLAPFREQPQFVF
ncbi:MAG TPA: protein-L-isoaspartate O-methyltransferase [Methylovirgula sp.]|nr:protein-L-isoaspartate O-methyltransferase [Methylovirgula sp.]